MIHKIKYLERLYIWIHVITGKMSIKALYKLSINVINYSNINSASYQLFQCNSLNELSDRYKDEEENIVNYFKLSIQVISSISILIIGINLCLIIVNLHNQYFSNIFSHL